MPFLIVSEKDRPGRSYKLVRPATTIGRRPTNDVVLSDPFASRVHAEVVALEGGRFEIRDIGGKHPVHVNENLVSRHVLVPGDKIRIGNSTIVFEAEERPGSAPIELAAPETLPREPVEVVSLDTRKTIPFQMDVFTSKDILVLQKDHQRLMLLYEFAKTVHSHLDDPRCLMEEILNTAFQTLDAERGFIALVDETTGELNCELARDLSAGVKTDKLSVSRTIVHKVLREGTALLTLDALQDNQFGRARSILEYEIRSAMCVPLLFEDKILGVIYLDNRASAGRFNQDDLVFLVALSQLAGIALGNANLHRQVVQENIRLVNALKPRIEIPGQSAGMTDVLTTLKKAAPRDVTVLVEGETGTGKEIIAKAIHALSPRSDKPFVAVNCAAIPKDLIESELFGHEKGAFTGAQATREGKFRQAEGGTLFLDEIGDMSLDTQAKVLRAIEEKEIQRVGGTQVFRVDVRVIAATNKNLGREVKQGRFREDLFYRLNVVPLRLPPLRERREDILPLADLFIAGRVKKISPKACQLLRAYSWPGNVRELKNCMERAVVLGDGEIIQPEDLPPHVRAGGTAISAPPESLESFEKDHIARVLRGTNGKKTDAARILGISRQTLDNKIKKYGIKI